MVRTNRRAKLPLWIRRPIQRFIRNFVFCSLAVLTLYNMYNAAKEYSRLGDVTQMYGFNPGRVIL